MVMVLDEIVQDVSLPWFKAGKPSNQDIIRNKLGKLT